MDPLKHVPDDENEIHDPLAHSDPSQINLTGVFRLPPEISLPLVEKFASIVRNGHEEEKRTPTPPGEIKRAQVFEEGEVFMLEAPFEKYFADRYIMDFYDVVAREICSRMHMHTGLRFVRVMTGPDTQLRVSSFSELVQFHSPAWTGADLEQFEDEMPDEYGSRRFNVVVTENTWIDMQIPAGVSHQFNASGPNAVIDSVHPEEHIETLRERMSGYNMMAQTIFFAEDHPNADSCVLGRTTSA